MDKNIAREVIHVFFVCQIVAPIFSYSVPAVGYNSNEADFRRQVMIPKTIESLLPRVSKPARYIGGEVNAVRKDKHSVEIRVALAFPDIYEVGMSHLGLKVLYLSLIHI